MLFFGLIIEMINFLSFYRGCDCLFVIQMVGFFGFGIIYFVWKGYLMEVVLYVV